MKKNIVLLSLLAASWAFGGEATVTDDSILSPIEKQPYSVTLQAGIMHTSVSSDQQVPSRLYGFTLSSEYQLNSPEESKFIHAVGGSIGFYTGNESGNYHAKYGKLYLDGQNNLLGFEGLEINGYGDVTVNVIPIMATYNAMYEATESLYFYAGVRAGAIIRNSDVKFSFDYKESDLQGNVTSTDVVYDSTSTNILPSLGFGFGMRAFFTEKLSFDISYDFNWTFGDDCDDIVGSDGTILNGVSENNRYYGTVKAGFSYSF